MKINKRSKIDKIDIYVTAQAIYKKLYLLQLKITKRDRAFLYPWILILALDVTKYISLVKRVKTKSLEYIEMLIGTFETLKLTIRSMVELGIIQDNGDKAELFSYIASIDDSLDKWYKYKSDIFSKHIIHDEQHLKDIIKETLIDVSIIRPEDVTYEKVKELNSLRTVKQCTLKYFLENRPLYMNSKIIDALNREMRNPKEWNVIYGRSKDELIKGSIHNIIKKIPCLIEQIPGKGAGPKYFHIYKFDDGWLCISGTQVKTNINFIIAHRNMFIKSNKDIIFYDDVNIESIDE